MVNIAVGNGPLSACTRGDADGSGDITINEIIFGGEQGSERMRVRLRISNCER